MKSFQEFCLLLEQDRQPWYVAVKPVDHAQVKRLLKFAESIDVPNLLSPSSLHCTLLYSKKPCLMPDIRPERLYTAVANQLEIFNGQDGKRVLVAKLTTADLKKRHEQLMKQTEGSYDYDEYIPHVTLSYDVGDTWEPSNKLIVPAVDLDMSLEYCEHINTDWS